MFVGGCGRQDKPEVLMRSAKTWNYSNLQGHSPDQITSEELPYLAYGQQMLKNVAIILFLFLENHHLKDFSPI